MKAIIWTVCVLSLINDILSIRQQLIPQITYYHEIKQIASNDKTVFVLFYDAKSPQTKQVMKDLHIIKNFKPIKKHDV